MPVEHNIFNSTPAHELIEELSHRANLFVAKKIAAALPETAFLRRQVVPAARRLQTFAERMTRIGYEIDTTSSATLQNSLFRVKDADIRKVCERKPQASSNANHDSGHGDVACQSYATR